MTLDQIEKMLIEAVDAWIDRIGMVEYIDDQQFSDGETLNPPYHRMIWNTGSPIL